MRAIILAGGKGERLLPYTVDVPKPLLPLMGRPALDIILEQLYLLGFEKVTLCVHYLAEIFQIFVELRQEKFKEMKIECVAEREALGTAGAIGQVDFEGEPNLVMNGDVVTNLNFKKLLEFHKRAKAMLTVASKPYSLRLDVGFVEANKDGAITGYTEKPVINNVASMGVYVYSPEIKKFIKPQKRLDFPDLVKNLIKAKEKILAFNNNALWLHLVSAQEYEKAGEFVEKNYSKLFNFTV